jgi:hypothetical protein
MIAGVSGEALNDAVGVCVRDDDEDEEEEGGEVDALGLLVVFVE